MLKFKKFNSIENVIHAEFMEHLREQEPQGNVWVVQEKVHGANSSLICDGVSVVMGKRTSLLEPDEKFYDYEELLERYSPKAMEVYNHLKKEHPTLECVSIFGELFGGRYPHEGVPAKKGMSLIQKGVFYTPDHEFYGYDIYITDAEGGSYLTVDQANEIFEKYGFFYAKTLMEGTLDQCLKHPNEFQSKIAHWLGFPEIEDNICEGVVIRPKQTWYLKNGDRAIIKNKSARFAEKKLSKPLNKVFKEPLPLSDQLKSLIVEAESYVNENRLANVVSHIGEIHMPYDFGKLIGLLAKDALEDFLKDQGGLYTGLDKCEQKLFTRQINTFCTALIKHVYMGRAYTTVEASVKKSDQETSGIKESDKSNEQSKSETSVQPSVQPSSESSGQDKDNDKCDQGSQLENKSEEGTPSEE